MTDPLQVLEQLHGKATERPRTHPFILLSDEDSISAVAQHNTFPELLAYTRALEAEYGATFGRIDKVRETRAALAAAVEEETKDA